MFAAIATILLASFFAVVYAIVLSKILTLDLEVPKAKETPNAKPGQA